MSIPVFPGFIAANVPSSQAFSYNTVIDSFLDQPDIMISLVSDGDDMDDMDVRTSYLP